MFKLLCAVALLLCSGLATAHHFHIARCLPSFGKYPFDEQKVRSLLLLLYTLHPLRINGFLLNHP